MTSESKGPDNDEVYKFTQDDINIIRQSTSICWMESVITALFFSKEINKYVWKKVFTFDKGTPAFPNGVIFPNIIDENECNNTVITYIILQNVLNLILIILNVSFQCDVCTARNSTKYFTRCEVCYNDRTSVPDYSPYEDDIKMISKFFEEYVYLMTKYTGERRIGISETSISGHHDGGYVDKLISNIINIYSLSKLHMNITTSPNTAIYPKDNSIIVVTNSTCRGYSFVPSVGAGGGSFIGSIYAPPCPAHVVSFIRLLDRIYLYDNEGTFDRGPTYPRNKLVTSIPTNLMSIEMCTSDGLFSDRVINHFDYGKYSMSWFIILNIDDDAVSTTDIVVNSITPDNSSIHYMLYNLALKNLTDAGHGRHTLSENYKNKLKSFSIFISNIFINYDKSIKHTDDTFDIIFSLITGSYSRSKIYYNLFRLESPAGLLTLSDATNLVIAAVHKLAYDRIARIMGKKITDEELELVIRNNIESIRDYISLHGFIDDRPSLRYGGGKNMYHTFIKYKTKYDKLVKLINNN
jgi:hypothetical protein